MTSSFIWYELLTTDPEAAARLAGIRQRRRCR